MGRFATLAPPDVGLRADNTPKGKGFFGELKLPDGGIATEFSIGVQFDGEETQIPTLVPTLTQQELDLLTNDIIPNRKPIPNSITQKAIDHAKQRIGQGKSPFAQEGEQANRAKTRFSDVGQPRTRFSNVGVEQPSQAEDFLEASQQIDRPGLIGRTIKGFVNKVFVQPARTIISKGGLGKTAITTELLEQAKKGKDVFKDVPQLRTPFDIFRPSVIRAIREATKPAEEKVEKEVAQVIPGFEVPPAETIPEKGVELVTGVSAFVTKLAVAKKFLGGEGFAGEVAAFELVNQAEAGVPGMGALLGVSLGGVGKIPAATLTGKGIKLVGQGGILAGLTAAQGGAPEDIAVAFVLPAVLRTFNQFPALVRGKRFDIKTAKDVQSKLPFMRDVPLKTITKWSAAMRDVLEVKKGNMTAERWGAKHGQNLTQFSDEAVEAFKKAGKPVPVQITGKAAEKLPVRPTPEPPAAPPVAKVPPKPRQVVTEGKVKITDRIDKLEGVEKTFFKDDTLTVYYDENISKEAVNIRVQKELADRRLKDSVSKITFISTEKGTFEEQARPAAEVTRQKDLLGREELRGGAAGVQQEFLEKEKFKLPEPDIEGQQIIPGAEKPTKPTKPAAIEEQDVKESDSTLLNKREQILSITEKNRTPQQTRELEDVENELINRHIEEFPEQDLGQRARKKEIKTITERIRSNDIYESALQEFQDALPDVSGTYLVDRKEMAEIREVFEGKPKVIARFTTDPSKAVVRWDQKGTERGIETFNEFLDAVELNTAIAVGPKRINQFVLDKAVASGEPEIILLNRKLEMLKDGFSAEEINEAIVDFAEFEGIDIKNVESEFIKPEVISDVETKRRVLKEIEGKRKKITERAPEPKRQAIRQAKEKAFKLKRDVFVTEKAGRFKVSVSPPKAGEFVRVSPPAKGEITQVVTEEVAGPTPEEIQEAKNLRRQINIIKIKKGLTEKQFGEIKKAKGGGKKLTRMGVSQLQEVLKGVKRARPKIVRHKKVVSLKTENQIAELRTNLTDLGFMNDKEFKNILNIEARGKEARFIDARNFITQVEGREILNRMHDTAQRLRVTEPVHRAIEKDFQIKRAIAKIEKLPRKAKDPSRLRSMRFFFQRLGEQAKEPIYEVFLDLTLEEQLRSRERHNAMKLVEKLSDFAKIANDPEALQRVEGWIVSQSVLKDRPKFPKDITENEIRLAKIIQASFKAYETLARAGKFFEFFDNRTEMPQYLKFKQGIDKAFDVYNTKGYDALIKYLDTQDWGIVSAGYSPMESVVRKVSTHRMPDIAVGKTRVRQRGITYRKQDRDILQRWYSYMRQMDQLIHLQPRIKSLVRLINDNQGSFVNPQRTSNVISTYLDNLKHTNYEDGLIEEFSRRLYSQAITVRVLADPLKVFRNLAQNLAFGEDRRDFFDPRNKRLTAEDVIYLETHVHQSSVMMTDWAFVGENPLVFKKLTKWVQRKTLYPSSDRINRLISFHAKINRVRRAFAKDQPLTQKMKDARFSDMQKSEQKVALGILAKDGVDAMARFVAKVHTDNTHFLYAREQRSPAEQTKLGRIALNLALFRRAALEKALLQLGKVFERGTGFGPKRRAASVLVTLLGMSALVGILWKKLTGQRYSPYSYFSFLELNFGGLEIATIQKAEDAYNSMFAIITADPEKRGKAVEAFGTNITKVADYMIPFYDLGLRAIEATLGSENIDRVPAKKLRELIDREYKSRGVKQIDRSLIEKIQFTFAKGGKKKPKQIGQDSIF